MMLQRIVEHKRKEIAGRKLEVPEEILRKGLAGNKKGSFKDAIARPGASLIAEVKRASPSKGVFRKRFDPVGLAVQYEKSGASAISVLTDSRFFKGSLQDLKRVKEEVDLPVLRKEFIIDPYQIYEAGLAGADAVLLIAAILSEQQLKDFILLSRELLMDPLVEVHSAGELETALRCGAEIIGINNRDLTTFETNIETTLRLAEAVPEDCLLVSESGISTGTDVRRLVKAGVDAILVGEALVTSSDVDTKIQELLKG
jgi:indole-3-glycerol phosphate synthase